MKKRTIALTAIACVSVLFITSCAMKSGSNDGGGYYAEYWGGNTYTELNEEGFLDVTAETDKSFISLSVNTASYADIKRQIRQGTYIDKSAVKIEEMVNYFKYDYPAPESGKPLSMSGAVIDTPWNTQTKLLTVGMKAEDIVYEDRTNNIVFLIDVSGSMFGGDRLPLVINAFSLLVDELTENDRVSIVTYASGVNTLLDGANGTQKNLIKQALSSLSAGGSTAGGKAIEKAYELAEKHKTDDVNQRSTVIIATDGDFNVGISNPHLLADMIESKKNKGIYLSAVGVGYGNMRNDTLETIADSGGGRHGYISNLTDARKFFVEELNGILNIVAEDAKAQIQFNGENVASYRLIGYENRQLTIEDWEDSTTNAGNIGSGLTVTAMYEIKLKQNAPLGNIASLTLKYKNPDTKAESEYSFDITAAHLNPASDSIDGIIKYEDRTFITCVIQTGLLLRSSSYAGTATFESIYSTLSNLNCTTSDEYKKEFMQLVETLKTRHYI